MRVRSLSRSARMLAAAALLVTGATAAHAQHRLHRQTPAYPGSCPEYSGSPIVVPSMPYVNGKTPDGQPSTDPAPTPAPVSQQPDFGSFVAAAGGGEGVALGSSVGYIDSAIPQTMFRLRFDANYRNNRPDRAEFFYPKCGCFRVAGIDPSADGPPLPETSVDYQTISGYLEYALGERFSVFVDVPWRLLNPDRNDNTAGLSDITFGGKYAFLYDCNQVGSLQVRVYTPSGDGDRGLGTSHYSIEPKLLYNRRLGQRGLLEAEFGDWIAIDGSDFAGNVLIYGLGLSYAVVDNCNFRVSPVAEVVGWTVLSGQQSLFPEDVIQDAAGDTIINGKVGVRFGFGRSQDPGMLNRSDLYLGYSRALTGDVWYKDSFRIEYRLRF